MVQNKLSRIILVAIVLIATFCRLYRIDEYMEFLGDQGRDVVIVSDFLKKGDLFFIGPQTSIGNMYLGPFYYYLIAPFLLLANLNPVGPSVFVAILSILTTVLIFFISQKWFNTKTGLIASFLFAISPVVIKYSNFSWNPNVMPFFALLFVYLTITAITENKYHLLNLASLTFIMALNSHFLALLLLPPAILFLAYSFFKNKPQQKNILVFSLTSLGIFLFSLIPQILFDLKHNGQNINAILTFFSKRETTVNLKAYKALPNIIPLFNQISTRLLAGKNEILGPLISLIFGVTLISKVIFSKNKKYLLVLLLWFLIGLIGLGLYKQHIYDHYFGFLFPIVFILFAVSINKYPVITIPVIITIAILSFIENPFRYPPNRQLKNTKEISAFIINQAQDKPFNLALIAKQNYDPPYRYFLNQQKAPLYTLKDKLTDQLFVICEPWQVECQPINHPLWDIAAFGWAKIDKEWELNGVKIFKLLHTKQDSL